MANLYPNGVQKNSPLGKRDSVYDIEFFVRTFYYN